MSVETVTHHEFPAGVHAELIIDNGNGDVTVHSVEFDSMEDDSRVVAPRQDIPRDYREKIVQYLEESGYTVRYEPAPA